MHRARRRIRQSADPFTSNSLFSAFFARWISSFAAAPPQVAASSSPIGGNCATRGSDTPATRRRSVSNGANPHHHRRGAHQRSRKARPQCPRAMAGLGQASSRHTEPPSTPLSPHFRYKTLPAHPTWPNLAQSAHAGRVLYRFHHHEAEQGEFCTEHEAEIELADTTALQAPPVWSGRHPRSRRNPPHDRRAAAGPAWVGRASASQISHAIPPRHDPTKAQKPQNIND